MMIVKTLFMLLAIVCAVLSAPVNYSQDSITSYVNNNDGSGNYKFSFGTSGRQFREETGQWVNKGQPGEHLEVIGEYSFITPDHKIYIIKYKSDQNGYQVLSSEQTTEIEDEDEGFGLPDSISSLLG